MIDLAVAILRLAVGIPILFLIGITCLIFGDDGTWDVLHTAGYVVIAWMRGDKDIRAVIDEIQRDFESMEEKRRRKAQ